MSKKGKSKAARKKEFLTKHPNCCFCGGLAKSEEPDHIPSRALFTNRQWPEGYEFPSCMRCNRATRYDEQVVAMLSRMYPDAETEQEIKEVRESVRAVAHNHPGLLEEMEPSARQVRRALKKYGLEKPEGKTTAEIPVLNVDGPLVGAAVENFGRKLCLALYYLHAGQILPVEGGVAIRWYTNLQIDDGELPEELGSVLAEFPQVERSKTDLADQFFYRYGMTESRDAAGFIAFFRRSFAIVGYVRSDRSKFALPPGARIFGPY